jgi:nitrate reductase molybdenum cofactor assembly chaperone
MYLTSTLKETIVKPAMIGVAQQLASQLLRYPTDALNRQLGHIIEIAELLPAGVGTPLAALADHLRTIDPEQAAAGYSATFLRDGGYPLYLSHPDDLTFTVTYQRAGLDLAEHERADYLPVVLEFAAARIVAGDYCGQELLSGYRPAIRALCAALAQRGSPYLLAMDVVTTTLPERYPVAAAAWQ